MYEFFKKYWFIPAIIVGLLLFASGTGVGLFTVKRQLNQVVKSIDEAERELSEIRNGIANIESISVDIEDRVGSLESSTGRIETAVDGIESANINIEYTLGVGEGLVGESEDIIRDSLAILESLSVEMDTNNSDGRSD